MHIGAKFEFLEMKILVINGTCRNLNGGIERRGQAVGHIPPARKGEAGLETHIGFQWLDKRHHVARQMLQKLPYR